MATLAALGRCLGQPGDRARSLALLAEATAILRSCPDPGRAARLVADQPGARRPRAAEGDATLTGREAAVLRLLPSQLSLREIADELYVSLNTVKTHSRTLYRKLSVTTRSQAVEAARVGVCCKRAQVAQRPEPPFAGSGQRGGRHPRIVTLCRSAVNVPCTRSLGSASARSAASRGLALDGAQRHRFSGLRRHPEGSGAHRTGRSTVGACNFGGGSVLRPRP